MISKLPLLFGSNTLYNEMGVGVELERHRICHLWMSRVKNLGFLSTVPQKKGSR